MILLDTNHLSEFKYRHHPRSMRLKLRMDAYHDQRFATPIIAYEEQHRGWLSVIARQSDPRKQVGAYSELSALARFLRHWEIVDFDDESAEQFLDQRRFRPRNPADRPAILCDHPPSRAAGIDARGKASHAVL